MKKAARNLSIAVLALGLAASATACSRNAESTVSSDCKPKHQFSTVEQGKLTVGITEIPPYSYTKDGKPAGADVELITEFASENCLELKTVPLAYVAAVPSVQNKRIDLTVGDWYRTAARTKIVNLSAPIYLDELGVISLDGLTNINDLKGKQVGTVDGYLWVNDLRKMLGSELKVYPSSVELKQDLESGRIDVGVDAYGTALYNFPEESKFKVTTVEPDDQVAATVEPAQSAFPYTKDNGELGKALDGTIEEKRKSGDLVKVLEENGLPATSAEVGEPRLIP
ncbi:substrate-binding periplasmic protein (plasmid) [Arthrobacter sp. G.S.26]|uniref:substrate-binding periplasmic protein n=1 Tax=Arthrobacter sp. G.S.26 TaxID=3433706 RepID=UPI003D7706F4